MRWRPVVIWLLLGCCAVTTGADETESSPVEISGIYPHLSSFNNDRECGIGAVVSWAGRLWWMTYPPHARHGSDDKLYSIGPDLQLTIHPESVGGTHANRLIHRESKQLFIGPYVIDAQGYVRAIDVHRQIPGRLTATARHLVDPTNKVYHVDMEGPVWEVDVHTLKARKLFEKPLPGWHGKGAYTAQGLLVVANNGEHSSLRDLDPTLITSDLEPKTPEDAGVLGAFDGRNWDVVLRRKFTDVTGPGGITGSPSDGDPLWATGWDKRSVLLALLDDRQWQVFRLPKASLTFDPQHGWYTEWPRIREAGSDRLLMTMHGAMFDFPRTFSAANTSGIRPICTHLRYVTDFCSWQDKLVIAADDTSVMQNPLAGQSQSNLWFGSLEKLQNFGPSCGWGGVWLDDKVEANVPSDPYLFVGCARRTLHVAHEESEPVEFTFEFDVDGAGRWQEGGTIIVPAHGYVHWEFPVEQTAQWVRLRTNRDVSSATAHFHYGDNRQEANDDASAFASLADTGQSQHWTSGIVRPAAHNRNLQFLCRTVRPDGATDDEQLWEIDEAAQFHAVENPVQIEEVERLCRVAVDFTVDEASVVLVNKSTGQRFRLPKGREQRNAEPGFMRAIREVASERSLANIHGTFYEIPKSEHNKEVLDFQRLKPVASHNKLITDFCTWRGLLVLAGCRTEASTDGHYYSAGAAQPGLWFGMIDDLWQLGKPVGVGGPWYETLVASNEPSDPYLMTNYDRKTLRLRHNADEPVVFQVEVDFTNGDRWKEYQSFEVPPGEETVYEFPAGYGAHWVRLVADKPCQATAEFEYR